MAFIMCEGFELCSTLADLSRTNCFSVGSGTAQLHSNARTGTKAMRYGSGQSCYLQRPLLPTEEHATIIVGTAVQRLGNVDCDFLAFCGDNFGTTHIVVVEDVNGAIRVARGGRTGTTLATSVPGVLPINVWCYLEVKVVLSDTIGVVQVRVNGAQVVQATSVDTKNAGTKNVIDGVGFGTISGAGGQENWFDDIYICNGAGSTSNDFMGECRVRTLLPTNNGANSVGVGNDTDSTDNFLLVNDATPSTGTATYVDLVNTGDEDTYTFADLSDLTGTVAGVQISTYGEKTDSAYRALAHVTRIGSGGVPGPFLTDPCEDYTTAPWTITGFTPTIVTGRTANAFSITNGGSGRISYDIPTGQQTDKLVLGAWMNFMSGSVYASLSPVITFRSDAGATEHLRVYFDYTGYIGVWRGSSASLGITSPGAYTPGSWQYFEISVGLGDLNGYAVVKVNGSIVLSVTNADTRNAGTKSVFDQVGFYNIGGAGITTPYLIDDLTLGGGLAPNEYLSSDIVLGTSYGWQRTVQDVNPATGAAFTRTDVNSAEFGVRAR